MKCTNCGSLAIDYTDNQAVCSQCGVVLEESQIVSDITFGENSAGGAVVQGSMISADQARARVSGPGGFRGGYVSESRELTISNARIGINNMASALRIPSHVADRALRFFTLALDGGASAASTDEPKNYVLGRKAEYTVASCLYVACRMEKTTHMLIDFADAIQVNVFILGRSYLKLIRVLNLRLPLIDPSIYIARFAALLDFGEETQKVAYDASRLVSRFQKDWITEGRRPAGICGACLMLAARMNHFRRSVSEIIQVVKIADVTLKARLNEFKSTPTGQLTVQDFRNVWLEEEHAPPAFLRAREPNISRKKRKAGRQPKFDADEDEADADGEGEDNVNDGNNASETDATIDPALDKVVDQATEDEIQQYLQQGLARELDRALETQELERETRAKAGAVGDSDHRPDTNLTAPSIPDAYGAGPSRMREQQLKLSQAQRMLPLGGLGMDVEDALQDGAIQRSAVDVQVSQGGANAGHDLADLDEEELDRFILSPEEVKIKERVWMEFNKDWMEHMLKKQLKVEHDIKMGVPVREPYKRKKPKAPRDASTAMHNSSAAESAKMMLKQKQFSKKINYDALNNLFPGGKDAGEGAASGKADSSGRNKGVASRKRGRQDSSEESSSSEDDQQSSAKDTVKKNGKRALANKSSKATELKRDHAVRDTPRHRRGQKLDKRAMLSSAAEESNVTDVGTEVDDFEDDQDAINVNNMRKQLGYGTQDDYEDEGEEIE